MGERAPSVQMLREWRRNEPRWLSLAKLQLDCRSSALLKNNKRLKADTDTKTLGITKGITAASWVASDGTNRSLQVPMSTKHVPDFLGRLLTHGRRKMERARTSEKRDDDQREEEVVFFCAWETERERRTHYGGLRRWERVWTPPLLSFEWCFACGFPSGRGRFGLGDGQKTRTAEGKIGREGERQRNEEEKRRKRGLYLTSRVQKTEEKEKRGGKDRETFTTLFSSIFSRFFFPRLPFFFYYSVSLDVNMYVSWWREDGRNERDIK